MSGQELMHFLHHEMDRTFRDGDPYECHVAILAKWNGEKLSDRLFGQNDLFSELENCKGKEDCYFSINSFFCERRSTANIRHLNAFVIDYDFYKIDQYKDLSASDMYHNHIKSTLPIEPTAVIDSGRGLYCIFALRHCSYHMTELYQHVYKNLIADQIQFGADSKATLVTQVIRIPGSINSRSGKEVRILNASFTRYKLTDLAGQLLPFSKKEAQEYREMNKKRATARASRSVNVTALEKDFKALIRMRNAAGIAEGYREQLIYLYWESLMWEGFSEQAIQKRVIRLNDLFSSPLDQQQLLKQCRPAKKYQYRTSYKTIIRKLEITEDEMKGLKLLVSSRESKRRTEKKRRRSIKGVTGKKEEIRQRREGIIKNLGNLKISEIADLFGVSKKTILRDLEYIRKHLAQFQSLLCTLWKIAASKLTEDRFIQCVVNFSADSTWNGLPEIWIRNGPMLSS